MWVSLSPVRRTSGTSRPQWCASPALKPTSRGLLCSSKPPPLLWTQRQRLLSGINAEAGTIRTQLRKESSAGEIIATLNARFFGPEGFAALTDLTAPENVSVAAVLDHRRGTCVGLAIVYLALAQRLGVDAHAVATPVPLFVRLKLDGHVRNVELLEAGREIDDDTYRRRYRIDQASITAGVFMRELTNAEVIAQLLSNQAVALSREGHLDEALARYDAALELAPRLVAAWYNWLAVIFGENHRKCDMTELVGFKRQLELALDGLPTLRTAPPPPLCGSRTEQPGNTLGVGVHAYPLHCRVVVRR